MNLINSPKVALNMMQMKRQRYIKFLTFNVPGISESCGEIKN